MLRDAVLRAHVWLLATAIPLLVRILPLPRLLCLLTGTSRRRLYSGVPAERVIAIVKHRLGRPRNMRRRACLREGLTLYHFLRLAGLPAEVHFGVFAPSAEAGRMHGHCWVTVDGVAVSAPPRQPVAVVLVRGPGVDSIGRSPDN